MSIHQAIPLRCPSRRRFGLRFTQRPDGSWFASQQWWLDVVTFGGIGLGTSLVGAIAHMSRSNGEDSKIGLVLAALGLPCLLLGAWCAIKRDSITIDPHGRELICVRRTRYRVLTCGYPIDRVSIHPLDIVGGAGFTTAKHGLGLFSNDAQVALVLAVDRHEEAIHAYTNSLPAPLRERIQTESLQVRLEQ